MSESSDGKKKKRLSKKTFVTKQLDHYASEYDISNKTRYISIKCGTDEKEKEIVEIFLKKKD